MLKKISIFLFFFNILINAGTFSDNTGIVVTDTKGKTYDIDALIASGKYILVHQTFSG